MLASEILTKDHREALSLIAKLENASDDGNSASDKETFDKLKAALELHVREEEEIYYPALARHEEFSDLMEENVPEHRMVQANLAQMSALEPSSKEFQEVLAETKTALEAHMENEETDVFPKAEEVLGRDKIEALGNEIEKLKSEAGMSRSAMM